MIALGFALTLASTAAGLVPPYLTMPLLNNVLIPRQNGLPVDFGVVPWYLAGLFGAALLAWLLGWAKTYVLARVSERISADLRNETYAHLQRLSLEFFGGKRTGDLDLARRQRHRPHLQLSLGQPARLLHRRADDRHDGGHPVLRSTRPWRSWHAAAVSVHRLDGADGARSAAARLRPHERRLGRDGQRPGRHDSRHPRREGVCPGKREIERFGRRNQHVLDANDRVNVLWSFFGPTVTLLTECGMLVIWGFGAWRVFNRPRIHRRRADRLHRLHRPVLHAARIDEPHSRVHAAGRRRDASHLRDPRPPCRAWPSR